jgi:protein-disulfide isomerase
MKSSMLARSLFLNRPLRASAVILLSLIILPASAATSDVVEGNPDSSIKVTIYEDLQCNYCQTLRTMLDEKLLPKYGKQVAFIHRDFPLGRHEWARSAAMAARWVHEQSTHLGLQFRREILDEQDHITPATLKPWVIEFARRNKLNQQDIAAALTDPRLSAIIDQDIQLATTRGVKKLPSVYVAGKSFVETIVFDDIAHTLDEVLTR